MKPVIKLTDISKSYKLFESPLEKAVYGLGLEKYAGWLRGVRETIPEHRALKNITLEVGRGERLGVIGRNGAGKSTLLKIITGVISPSAGERHIIDNVEALFDAATGFNPEMTGLENIENGLRLRLGKNIARMGEATKEVIEFVELGAYLNQPIKNYSKGMSTRLAFAVATAVRPDVVVIDEVLGAGDAYFSTKAARRMRSLLGGNATLILVSHSTKQVLQFCERSMWLENGEIVMEGESLKVIKAYEEFIERLRYRSVTIPQGRSVLEDDSFRQSVLEETLRSISGNELKGVYKDSAPALQDNEAPSLPIESNIICKTGLSRWPQTKKGLLVRHVWMTDAAGAPVSVIETSSPFCIHIDYEADVGPLSCKFVVLFFTAEGQWMSRQVSEVETVQGRAGVIYRKTLRFDANYFGSGNIVFTVALFETEGGIRAEDNLETLSRSFEFQVINAQKDDRSIFCHPCTWESSRVIENAPPEPVAAGVKA